MRNKQLLKLLKIEYWGLAYCILIPITALISWIGSIYGFPVKSLISQEGIRWSVRNVLNNFIISPLVPIMVLAMGLGLLQYSGFFYHLFNNYRSVKQQRALTLAFLIGILYTAAIVLMVMMPHAILLSATGNISSSPLTEGLVSIIALGVGLMGLVYGSASGQFRTLGNVSAGLSSLLSKLAPYFVVLFLASQLVAAIQYSKINALFHLNGLEGGIFVGILYYLPLILLLMQGNFYKNSL